MEILLSLVETWTPFLATTLFFIFCYNIAKRLLERETKGKSNKALLKSIILFSILFIGIISVILVLPMTDTQRGQVTSLIGIVLSAVLGLSATTFIGNGLAGIALRMRNSFKPGDFIEVNGIFGRVTEQGLFTTEIQTIDSDLTTMPNLSLSSNPIKVTRSSGTCISVDVSLGYDVNRLKIEESLIKAAKSIQLKEPFVHILSLGDFSIVYRIHGLLEDVKSIVSARSKLTGAVIDELHAANIEIVSPSFMNQRQVGETVFISKKYRVKDKQILEENTPEQFLFDKAEEAESIEKRRALLADIEAKIENEKAQLKETKDVEEKAKIQKKLDTTVALREKLLTKIDERINKLESSD